ncbi:MAG: hypothetical protein JXA09_05675 [Anaerolineae bacterium]|nr:hypothetical protein [Anaerolineae bacterium]
MSSIEVRQVSGRRDLRAFVRFPWRVYEDDPNWVPPLIAEQMRTLDPATGPFFGQADVALFLARRERDVVGRVAVFTHHRREPREDGGLEAGFGFFEALDDDAVVHALFDAGCAWLRARGATILYGPTSFGDNDSPGILIEGADCPPVMLEAHTAPYYPALLERYGMEKDHDLYAWRAFREQIGAELTNLPPEVARVAEVAKRVSKVEIRTIRMEDWADEVERARTLFNVTLRDLIDHVDVSQDEFAQLANQMRPFLDPDLALFAEVEGKCVGFCVAIPDVNQVLIHLNGRLYPFNWLKVRRYIRQIDVVSFKLMGVLPEYRRRGIDALLYMEAIKQVYAKGYAWLDGSLTSEYNATVNMIAQRLGAQRYKQYRIYRMAL